MKRLMTGIAAVLTLSTATTLLAQGSGSTSGTSKPPATSSSYKTVKSLSGTITARSGDVVTVRAGRKSRQFKLNPTTRFVGTNGKTSDAGSFSRGQKIKISYNSSAPDVAVEVRRRG